MTVTRIEPLTKIKFKIYLDGSFAFVLYKGELSRFGITAGAEISEETVERIRKEVIFKRARLRAMHLLEDMDRTEAGLREKLRQGLYPEDASEEAIRYVKSFGYLDDARYAENFVRSRQGSKSRREIQALLLRKGITSDKIEAAFESCCSEDGGGEEEAIRKILKKKGFSQGSIHDRLLGYILSSPAEYVILPAADFLGLGSEGHINTPGTVGSPNWEWRLPQLDGIEKELLRYRKQILRG